MKQRTAEARKAAAKNGSTAATQQKVRQAPNTAPKHANPKTWRQRTAAKVDGPKRRAKTGAPPLFLGLCAVGPPGDVRGLRLLVEKSRSERQRFRDLATGDVTDQIWWALLELAERTMYPRLAHRGLENAAEDLAVMAITAANFLADLARSDSFGERLRIERAARRKNYWPVLLRLGAKQAGKGRRQPTLEGWDKTKAYLSNIHLGQDAPAELRYLGDRRASPFKRAAAWLLYRLREWHENGVWCQFARDGKITPWATRLCALGDEMTPENADEWWSVAKVWVDEQWEANRNSFEPLISHLKLDIAKQTPSLVKRQVIDDSLKKAFKALAGDSLKEALRDIAAPSNL